MQKKKTKVGVFYITEFDKPEEPIKIFDSFRYASNYAMWIVKNYGKEISLYQFDTKNNKPQKITTYSV
jgi:hypothetical protein